MESGNPQGTHAAYLAGLLDGEGSVMAYASPYKGKLFYHPRIVAVSSVEQEMLTHTHDLLMLFEIPHYVALHAIVLDRWGSVRAYAAIVRPFTVLKRLRLDLLDGWCALKSEWKRFHSRPRRTPQHPFDEPMFQLLKRLNIKPRNRTLNEHTQALAEASMMCSELGREVERLQKCGPAAYTRSVK